MYMLCIRANKATFDFDFISRSLGWREVTYYPGTVLWCGVAGIGAGKGWGVHGMIEEGGRVGAWSTSLTVLGLVGEHMKSE